MSKEIKMPSLKTLINLVSRMMEDASSIQNKDIVQEKCLLEIFNAVSEALEGQELFYNLQALLEQVNDSLDSCNSLKEKVTDEDVARLNKAVEEYKKHENEENSKQEFNINNLMVMKKKICEKIHEIGVNDPKYCTASIYPDSVDVETFEQFTERKKNEEKILEGSVQIKIKTLTGKIFDVNVELDDDVLKLKKKVKILEGIPVDQIRLIFNGVQLEDGRKLNSYNVISGSMLHLVLRLRGGKPVIMVYDDECKKNEQQELKISLGFNEEIASLSSVYPKPTFTNGKYEWSGNYTIDDKNESVLTIDDKKYNYIFWECDVKNHQYFDKEDDKWIVIKKENKIQEMEEILHKTGMNDKEINDFMVYWMKTIMRYEDMAVRIEDQRYSEAIPLEVKGFDQIHRVFIVMKGIEQKEMKGKQMTINEIPTMTRPTGKYILEWGALPLN